MTAEVMNLSVVCLKTVVKNFSKYNTAYNFSQDAKLLKQLEFLQRVYTFDVMLELSKESELKDEYLNILINKYLKKLDLRLLLNCSSEAILKQVSKIGQGLVEVTWDGNLPSDVSANTLVRHLPNVKILNLPNVCTDETLQIIAKYCPNLRELDVHNSFKLTGKGLRSLCHQNESGMQCNSLLKVLCLEGTFLQDDDIAFLLEKLPFLEILNYTNVPLVLYSMHKKELECGTLYKARKYRLTELNFMKCEYEQKDIKTADILNVCSELCPHVAKISLPVAFPQHLNLCCNFINLQSVTIESENRNPDININNFLTLKGNNIHNLDVRAITLSATVLVQNCPNVEVLTLRSVEFHLTNNENSISLKRFREFTLENAVFLDSATTPSINLILTSSPNLESLSFRFCEFSGSEMAEKLLEYCKGDTLKHIYFGFCDVELSLLQSILLSCASLQSLSIEFCDNLDDIDLLKDIASNLKNSPAIICNEYISDLSDDNSDFEDYSDEYDYNDIYDDDYYDEYCDHYDVSYEFSYDEDDGF